MDEPPWSAAKRVIFRFFALYVALWLAPWPLPLWIIEAPLGLHLNGLISDAIVPWVGRDLLGIAGTYETWAASGDTAYRWVFHLVIVVLAAFGAAVWSAADRLRADHRRGLLWLTVYLRFYLAGQMIGYGFDKLAGAQFAAGSHRTERLYTALGDLTPQELLWEFMGHSWIYSGFTGLAEVVGGLLLFSRRTTTLGALLLTCVLANVFLLNVFYDVPVKLFSGHLLVIAIFLAARDARPLFDLFVRGRSASLATLPAPTTTPRGAKIWRFVRALVIAELVAFPVVQTFGPRIYAAVRAPAPHPLAGVYEVDRFTRDGREVPPSYAEVDRWSLVIIDRAGRPHVRLADGRFETFWSYPIASDSDTITPRRVVDDATKEHVEVGELRYLREGVGVVIDGELDGHALRATLKPSGRRFELAERPLHLRQGG